MGRNIEEMGLEELWELFPIILRPYDSRWKKWAEDEIDILKGLTGDLASNIYHIGSTAIEGIWAKPTVDLLVETAEFENLDVISNKLKEAGYLLMNKSAERICMVKGYTPEGFAEKVFHIHIRREGDNDELYFRDYLRNNPDVAKEYEKLKLISGERFKHNRDAYTDSKSDFIKHYTSLAKKKYLKK